MREFLKTADVLAVRQRHTARVAAEEAAKKRAAEDHEAVVQKLDTDREDYLKQVQADAEKDAAYKRIHAFDDL